MTDADKDLAFLVHQNDQAAATVRDMLAYAKAVEVVVARMLAAAAATDEPEDEPA